MSTRQQSMIGKTIVVTGASSGAGRAIALAFAEAGARLVLAARNKDALQEAVEECRLLGADAIGVPTDTRHAPQHKILVERARAAFGTIDVWVNNAGVLAAGLLEDVPSEINEAVIRTNLIGYVHGAQAVLPVFKYQGHGVLINNISVGAWLPTPYMAAYCASKFGLKGFTEALRGELRSYPDIHVCDLFPGFLDTPGMQHSANYTGRVLKPAPPLSDPRQVARAAVRLAQHPRERSALGIFPHLAHAAASIFPKLTRTIVGTVIGTYLKNAPAAPDTEGNVFESVSYGNSVDGAWRTVGLAPKPRTKAALAAAVFGAAALFCSREGVPENECGIQREGYRGGSFR